MVAAGPSFPAAPRGLLVSDGRQSPTYPVKFVDLPVPPSTNQLYGNAKRGGRVKTEAYRRWLASAGLIVNAAHLARIPDRTPARITIRAHTSRRRDLGNIEKPTSDLMVRMCVLPDDRYLDQIVLVRDGTLEPESIRVFVAQLP